MTALALFAATFMVVFLLGLQQINVERRSIVAAALTSPLIGAATLVQFKVLPGPTGALDLAGYLLGGAAGIAAAVWLHPAMARRMWLLSQWCKRHGLQRAPRRVPGPATEGAESFTPQDPGAPPAGLGAAPRPAPRTPDDHALRLVDTLRIATELADEAAREHLEGYCVSVDHDSRTWHDTQLPAVKGADPQFIETSEITDECDLDSIAGDDQACVDRAVRYLDLRDQLVRHPTITRLVRVRP